jgi:hypothetical protein
VVAFTTGRYQAQPLVVRCGAAPLRIPGPLIARLATGGARMPCACLARASERVAGGARLARPWRPGRGGRGLRALIWPRLWCKSACSLRPPTWLPVGHCTCFSPHRPDLAASVFTRVSHIDIIQSNLSFSPHLPAVDPCAHQTVAPRPARAQGPRRGRGSDGGRRLWRPGSAGALSGPRQGAQPCHTRVAWARQPVTS